eukprot:TRINITY_DN3852_c0_g1_i1.p1 TRINITY_DN3852_c0_g1~~TRINITY_DN3852_c0_g1_i1.p1  ORF type:complete len:468 (-),score=116.96 TRINITY_DN3852_c0_g1_i1:2-1405(-)
MEETGHRKPIQTSSSVLKVGLWLFCVCFCMAGVQFIYSVQFAVGMPFFSSEFKLPVGLTSVILGTAGPISGFIVQPVVGVYSDHCSSRFGRRRPFILGGAILSITGMLVIANSVGIGKVLGDNIDGPSSSDHRIGAIFAIGGLWLINMAVNIIMGPGRALIADLLPPEQLNLGNAMIVATMALSSVAANIMGAQLMSLPNAYRTLFYIGAAFTGLSCVPTLIAAKETPYTGDPGPSSPLVVFKKIGIAFATMNSSVLRIGLVFFFSWCGYTPYMFYITSYFAVNVFHGDSTATSGDAYDRYQHGVQWGMYASAIFSVVSFFFSLVLPTFLKKLGIKPVYSGAQAIAAVSFVLMAYLSISGKITLAWAVVLSAIVSINFTTFNAVPYALLAQAVTANAGLYMGVLNSASVVSQTVTGIIAGQIITARGGNLSWGIAFGGLLSLIAGVLAFVLPTDKKAEPEEKEPLIQ